MLKSVILIVSTKFDRRILVPAVNLSKFSDSNVLSSVHPRFLLSVGCWNFILLFSASPFHLYSLLSSSPFFAYCRIFFLRQYLCQISLSHRPNGNWFHILLSRVLLYWDYVSFLHKKIKMYFDPSIIFYWHGTRARVRNMTDGVAVRMILLPFGYLYAPNKMQCFSTHVLFQLPPSRIQSDLSFQVV